MNWVGRSIIGLAIGSVVVLAVLAGPIHRVLDWRGPGWSDSTGPASARAGGPGRGGGTLATLHARQQAECHRAVAQIRAEFGLELQPERFVSHHAARDYLERLRLGRRAGQLGIEVDPQAFGDDEFMRRYLAARLPGGLEALAAAEATGPPADRPALRSRSVSGPADYVFINGRRYYSDGQGAYVDDDGSVLLTSPNQTRSQQTQQGAVAANGPDGQVPLNADTLGDLDMLLEMLLPQSKADTSSP